MRKMLLFLTLCCHPWCFAQKSAQGAQQTAQTSIAINRIWERLTEPTTPQTYRRAFKQAGALLGAWKIHVGGLTIDGALLQTLAQLHPNEPFVRVVREKLRRPVDLLDFLLFLDDVLRAGDDSNGIPIRDQLVWVTSGRARNGGIFLHPDDVFKKDKPRLYAAKARHLPIDKPARPAQLAPAEDGELLGPRWTARYRNPGNQRVRLAALDDANPSGTFGIRIRHLLQQLKQQDCIVGVHSTVRNRARGYLMWGAFTLSQQTTRNGVKKKIEKLRRRNKEWHLDIPIEWSHPKGWKATIEAAQQMRDTYQVVYATERGARYSNHYDGVAVDFTAIGLPRKLTLEAPDGTTQMFDLSKPDEPRDLSLTPELIAWVEKHFQMSKLRSDYPHWDDAAPASPTLTQDP